MTASAVIVQCVSGAAKRPTALQVAFNASAAGISSALAYAVHTAAAAVGTSGGHGVELLVLSGTAYFVVNTFTVSGIIGLTSNTGIVDVWRRWHLACFPYYLVGSLIASVVVAHGELMSGMLIILPALAWVHTVFRTYIDGTAPTQS
jgi:hypothetical protein